MPYEFKLPDLGEGLTEGEIARWLVSEGDTVGEVIEVLSARYGERFSRIVDVGSAVVDGERVGRETVMADGQEVALLPPVSGGARRRPSPPVRERPPLTY